MGKLRKYEIDAIVGEIQSTLERKPKDLSKYKDKVKIVKKYEDKLLKLRAELTKINTLKGDYLKSLGCSRVLPSPSLALELFKLEGKIPSTTELERKVILSDSSELGEIVSNIVAQYE